MKLQNLYTGLESMKMMPMEVTNKFWLVDIHVFHKESQEFLLAIHLTLEQVQMAFWWMNQNTLWE